MLRTLVAHAEHEIRRLNSAWTWLDEARAKGESPTDSINQWIKGAEEALESGMKWDIRKYLADWIYISREAVMDSERLFSEQSELRACLLGIVDRFDTESASPEVKEICADLRAYGLGMGITHPPGTKIPSWLQPGDETDGSK